MDGNKRKWVVLLLFLIALPVALLTYLSARSFQSEQRAARADINLLVPALQQALYQRLDALSASADQREGSALRGIGYTIRLDGDGSFLHPRYLPMALSERDPDFAAAQRRGEIAEFIDGDLAVAASLYEAAQTQARHPREALENFNAQARVALARGHLEQARALHERIKPGTALDPDGSEPLSLSYLRLAHYSRGEEAVVLLEEWVDGLFSGAYPFSAGTPYLLDQALSFTGVRGRSGALRQKLDRAKRLLYALETYIELQRAGLISGAVQTFSALDPEGNSLLMCLLPQSDAHALLLVYDLPALAEHLLQTPTGQQLAQRGLTLELFDSDHTARFALRHRDVAHQVVPASAATYRLRLGIYVRDQALVLQSYRRRNFMFTTGILLLAAAIAGGAYLIFRDASREVLTARLRSEFVANVSHELRTPLTSIRMYAETLLLGRHRDAEQLRDYLQTIVQESQRLSRMVDNMLDFSRMESGRKTYDFAPLNLGAITQRALEEFAPLLREHGFAVELDIADGLPPVRADADSLHAALANLLSNAVKYSGPQRYIRVRLWRQDHYQCIEIADRGIGVPAEDREHIFDKFHRAANSGGSAVGTGLGLALVQGIAHAHAGTVSYRPRSGGGSAFVLKIPQQPT